MPLKNSLCLLLAATIWGIAFVAQSVGMEYVEPLHLQRRSFPDRCCCSGSGDLYPKPFQRYILCSDRLRNTGILINTSKHLPHSIQHP